MASYCFSLSIDGDEQPAPSAEHPDRQSAVWQAREALLTVMARMRPRRAYCVVYASGDIEGEALGVWDVSREAPLPVWTPNE